MATIDAVRPAAKLLSHEAPWYVGAVTLTVHDLDTIVAFYRDAIGFAVLANEGHRATLGAGGVELLHLVEDRKARLRSPNEAGLFHTAFLTPSRIDLADWVRHAIRIKLPIEGASDHRVSEALYLSDPEGNGIEIYTDRPRERWLWEDAGARIVMGTQRLDLDDLLQQGEDRPFNGMAAGTRVGHIHLQVGEIAAAESFYSGVLGLDITAQRPAATFFSTGHYHHHLGANVWQSKGAAPRDLPSTGLVGFEWVATDLADLAALRARLAEKGVAVSGEADRISLHDPWRNEIVLRVA